VVHEPGPHTIPAATCTKPDSGLGTTEIDLVLSPKRRRQKPLFIVSPPLQLGSDDDIHSGSVNVKPALSGDRRDKQRKGKGKEKERSIAQDDSDGFGDDGMDFDAELLRGLDMIEKEAYANAARMEMIPSPPSAIASISGSSSCSGIGKPQSFAVPTTRSTAQAVEVITIEDDNENGNAEDKENVPVPTRHVRRRTDNNDQDGSAGLRRQKARETGKPTLSITSASSIIDLSDD
jgi:RecQ-mediated genome instability protein 1